ncbi:hypothetical protein GCM10009037_01110 [Halarchaeum grantii]|uniref:Methyltransferase domain-containing protein n=2 Tax=Halarchaeum grantii TaxID=1193105 RepID=A0A830F5M2_9EURY|nr:hypothetical protein GCM10009037_01110 [Halarchaeum grantii]
MRPDQTDVEYPTDAQAATRRHVRLRRHADDTQRTRYRDRIYRSAEHVVAIGHGLTCGAGTADVATEPLCERLTAAATELEATLDGKVPENLGEAATEWCELHGFNPTTLSDHLPRLARHAVLSIFLKAVVYEREHRAGNLPLLTTPIREAFREADHKLETAVFAETVLDDVAFRLNDRALQRVLDARDRFLDARYPAVAIGRLYEAITSTEARQRLGQFYTPRWLRDLMLTWVPADAPTLLDLGVGAGSLSMPFHPRFEVSTEPDHIAGIDRNPLARLMATVALILSRQPHEVHVEDFLELAPDDLESASRNGFRFILNETDARHINNFYAFDALMLDETELKALLAFLNSGVFDDVVHRYRYAREGGFEKIEPNDLEGVPVLDPRGLPEDVVSRLAASFDELCETARRGGDDGNVFARIESLIRRRL